MARAVTSTSSIWNWRYNESNSASSIAKTERAQSANNSMRNSFFIIVRPNPGGLINRAKCKRSDLGRSAITVAGQSGILTRVLLLRFAVIF